MSVDATVGMHLPKRALFDCQRLLQQVRRFGIAFLVNQRPRQNRQIRRRLGIILAVPRLHDVQRLAVVLLRCGVVSRVQLDRAQVDQDFGHAWMPFAVDLFIHCQSALVDRFGLFIMPCIKMRVRQFVQTIRKVHGFRAWSRIKLYGLLQNRDGLVVGAAIFQHSSER